MNSNMPLTCDPVPLSSLRDNSTDQNFDDELTADVCKEVRAHMGACPKCELFLDSLRQTISLCRHFEASPLSPSKKLQLRREIQKAISRA